MYSQVTYRDSVAEIGGSRGVKTTLELVQTGVCKHTPTTTTPKKERKKERKRVHHLEQMAHYMSRDTTIVFLVLTVICDTAELVSLGKQMCQDEIMAFAWSFVFMEA